MICKKYLEKSMTSYYQVTRFTGEVIFATQNFMQALIISRRTRSRIGIVKIFIKRG